MKISLDAGALCSKELFRFGNYTFTKSFVEAIEKYDRSNEYFMYSFCPKPPWLRVNKRYSYKILRPKTLWLSSRVSLEELKEKKDIFLALNQAVPLMSNSKIISFSHGLSFYFFPKLYRDSYYALLDQLGPMIKKSKYIIVSSRRVKTEMLKIFPHYKNFVVANYGIPFDMLKHEAVIRRKFFLYVGMDHPIKNIEFLTKVFKKFRKDKKFLGYSLYLVGNLKRYEDMSNNITAFTSITRQNLRKLYATATAYITTSFYESFNFPVLEALAQKCTVMGLKSAIIPEFKKFVFEVQQDDELVDLMRAVALGKSIFIDVEMIKKMFSWKKYVSKLLSLYR